LKLTGKSVEKLLFYLGSCSNSGEYNSFQHEFTAQQPSEIDNLVGVQEVQLFWISRVLENYEQDKHISCFLGDLCWQNLLLLFSVSNQKKYIYCSAWVVGGGDQNSFRVNKLESLHFRFLCYSAQKAWFLWRLISHMNAIERCICICKANVSIKTNLGD
jgi:hypothetical protein